MAGWERLFPLLTLLGIPAPLDKVGACQSNLIPQRPSNPTHRSPPIRLCHRCAKTTKWVIITRGTTNMGTTRVGNRVSSTNALGSSPKNNSRWATTITMRMSARPRIFQVSSTRIRTVDSKGTHIIAKIAVTPITMSPIPALTANSGGRRPAASIRRKAVPMGARTM